MAKLGLRLLSTFIYTLAFCCAAIILGIYSYFLAVLADRDLPLATYKKAVTGLAGAAVLYLAFAILLTCFLGGIRFFAFLAVLLDLLFFGAFLAIAVMTRDGRRRCRGNVRTPLGNGPENSGDPGYGDGGFGFGDRNNSTYAPRLGRACKLNQSCFAVAIIGAFLLLIALILQILLARQRRREKQYGATTVPHNGYATAAPKRKFWQRGPRATHRDTEMAPVGTTVPLGTAAEHSTLPPHEQRAADTGTLPSAHGGYYTAPKGTATNY